MRRGRRRRRRRGKEKRKENRKRNGEFRSHSGVVARGEKKLSKTLGNKRQTISEFYDLTLARTNTKRNYILSLETFLHERIRKVFRGSICSLVQSKPFPNKLPAQSFI